MVLKILLWPNPKLAAVSHGVSPNRMASPEFKQLVEDLFNTLYDSGGIGLSAIQVGVPERVLVMDTGTPYVIVNPDIVGYTGVQEAMNEGCLSLPGIVEQVLRYPGCTATYHDAFGKRVTTVFTGTEAQCLQHEHDHLNGITIPMKVGTTRAELIRSKMEKLKKSKGQP